ncbi:hypothetical protein GE061_008845 [Apolygus lucorum]|nr:hypothetical protein GE061_008845 [Apolygus lucorum]
MKVHQVTWSRSSNTLHFNTLSCFVCQPGTHCVHYSIDQPQQLPDDKNGSDEDETTISKNSSSSKQVGVNQMPTFPPQTLDEGDWIAVTQGKSWLPGILEQIFEEDLEVNLLSPSGKFFSWPDPPARQRVNKAAVLCKIENPTSVSSRLMAVKDEKYISFLTKTVVH